MREERTLCWAVACLSVWGMLCPPGHYLWVWVAGHLPVLDGPWGPGATEVVLGAMPVVSFVVALVVFAVALMCLLAQDRSRM